MGSATAPNELGDAVLARMAAQQAGRVLLDLRSTGDGPAVDMRVSDTVDMRVSDTVDMRVSDTVGKRGDAAAQVVIASILREARPGDAVLSEEARDDPARLNAERVWIIDPLDGTREFGEAGRTDWAVHVALWERGELVAGAVALPALGVVLCSDQPPPQPPPTGALRIAVSRTRPPSLVADLVTRLGAELVPMGSAGYKVAAVIRGEVEAYVHGGGQYEWDSAAPVAVARAAGLHTSRLDGSPLCYNQPDPLLPDLLVCRPELASSLLNAIDLAGAAR